MHEMALTQDLVELISERFAGRRVTRVVLEIGKLCAVVPDAFRFCFGLCVAGTVADGAELEILETQGLARCRRCGADFGVDGPLGICRCGCEDLELSGGDQLRLKAVEVI